MKKTPFEERVALPFPPRPMLTTLRPVAPMTSRIVIHYRQCNFHFPMQSGDAPHERLPWDCQAMGDRLPSIQRLIRVSRPLRWVRARKGHQQTSQEHCPTTKSAITFFTRAGRGSGSFMEFNDGTSLPNDFKENLLILI